MYPLAKQLICITGPTGIGKSDLAQALSEQIGASILSCDSMQIYQGMDIGTGKVALKDRSVEYYGLDIVAPGQEYSAALYQEYARNCIEKLDREGKQCVVCGGTGFYLKAAIDEYDFPKGELADNPIRRGYQEYLDAQGPEALWKILWEKDQDSATLIHWNNSRRVIRALEVLEEGRSYSELKEQLRSIPQHYPAYIFGLHMDRELLYARINARVDKMISAGLLCEVQDLLDRGFKDALTAPQAIGYKELVAYLDGQCSLEGAIEAIKQASRRYAKRQISWFKRDERTIWIDASQSLEAQLDEIYSAMDERR